MATQTIQLPVRAQTLPIDLAALSQKYAEERAKGVGLKRPGIKQYRSLDTDRAYLSDDPFATTKIERKPVVAEYDVVIIGGGYGGQIQAAELIKAGITNFRIIEKGSDFGGTWYWNRFPGARCDVESYVYMPLLDDTDYIPTEKYATGPELFRYAQLIARRFGLYKKAFLQTAVTKLKWTETAACWDVRTSRGDFIRAKHVISVMGPLQRPKVPVVKDIENFKGHIFHTARWDWNYTGGQPSNDDLPALAGKRVGIIGTGATGVQVVPEVAKWAKQLYVFQRTPSSIDIRANQPTSPEWAESLSRNWAQRRIENFSRVLAGVATDEDLVNDSLTRTTGKLNAALANSQGQRSKEVELLDFETMERIRARVDTEVHDRRTAAALKPYFHLNCKRPCFSDTYLKTFNLPNTRLVDTNGKGVERFTSSGVIVNGEAIDVDVMIFATGFEFATSFASRHGMQVVGRDGLNLDDKWATGISTLYGETSRGFPNMWHIQAFQSGLSSGNTLVAMAHAKNIVYALKRCQELGIGSIEPTQQAEDAWVEGIVTAKKNTKVWRDTCTPGYLNDEGEESIEGLKRGFMPLLKFEEILSSWRQDNRLDGFDVKHQRQ